MDEFDILMEHMTSINHGNHGSMRDIQPNIGKTWAWILTCFDGWHEAYKIIIGMTTGTK
jgi:hypothetical protein